MGTPAHCTLTHGKEHGDLRPLVNFFGSKAEQWRITKIIPKIWRRETSATRAIMAISSKLRPKWFKNPPKLTETTPLPKIQWEKMKIENFLSEVSAGQQPIRNSVSTSGNMVRLKASP